MKVKRFANEYDSDEVINKWIEENGYELVTLAVTSEFSILVVYEEEPKRVVLEFDGEKVINHMDRYCTKQAAEPIPDWYKRQRPEML